LSEKYDEYKYLKREYYDGILLFSIMEDEVWTRAGKDSTGLSNFYSQNKSNFIDTTKLFTAIFSANNQEIIDSIALRVPTTAIYKSLSNKEKESILNQYNGSPQLSLHLDSGEFVIDQHLVLQNLSLPYRESILKVENKWYYVLPLRDPSQPLPKDAVMGKLIADYQDILEEQWLKELKQAYSVKVNEATLNRVYKKLETL
jgi:peptidyl-prolyl cis-trans isomerase SurA